jgi:hypothetical protein
LFLEPVIRAIYFNNPRLAELIRKTFKRQAADDQWKLINDFLEQPTLQRLLNHMLAFNVKKTVLMKGVFQVGVTEGFHLEVRFIEILVVFNRKGAA